jgi:hypothetical protein
MKKIVLILISILTFGCSSNEDNLEGEYAEYINSNSIASEIQFMPEEVHADYYVVQKPTLRLKLITKELFPCINYGIVTSEFINGSELIVRFEEIVNSGVCATAIGPATKYIDLPQNINKLTFINGKTIDQYSITIDSQKVKINLIESSFTTSLYDNTFRYPENSFAYICGTNTTNTNIYTDFLNILLANPSLKEISFQGEGRIPYPISTSGNWVNHKTRFFKYNNFSDFESLGQTLTNYKNGNITPNSGVTIALESWNNSKHLSWMN